MFCKLIWHRKIKMKERGTKHRKMSSDERKISFFAGGETETGDLRGCKPVQSGMRTNKVKEEHKHGDQVISALKGRKALLLVRCEN